MGSSESLHIRGGRVESFVVNVLLSLQIYGIYGLLNEKYSRTEHSLAQFVGVCNKPVLLVIVKTTLSIELYVSSNILT